jgi:hypothetical protein
MTYSSTPSAISAPISPWASDADGAPPSALARAPLGVPLIIRIGFARVFGSTKTSAEIEEREIDV